MNNIYIIHYGYNYEHDRILGAFITKKQAKKELSKFFEDCKYDYCYIEKLEIGKLYKEK